MDDEFYHSMYQEDDEDASPAPAKTGGETTLEMISTGNAIRISVDGKDVHVPALKYVRDLERAVDTLTRQVRRLEANLARMRENNRRLATAIDGVSHDLEGKLDRP